MAKSLKRTVHIYINGAEIGNTLKDLRNEVRKLEIEQAKLPIGSQDYIDTSMKLAEVKSVIKDQGLAIKELSRTTEEARERLANLSTILVGLKTLWGKGSDLFDKLKDLAADAAALDDVYADVQKTTGLTHEEVEKLNEAERPFSSSHLLKIPIKLL